MSEEVKALSEGIEALGKDIEQKMSEYNAELEKHGNVSTELTGKLDELSGKYEEMKNDLMDLVQKQPTVTGAEKHMTWGESVTGSDEFKSMISAKSKSAGFRMEVKNTTINSNLSAVYGDSTTVFPNQRQGVIGGDFVPVTVRQVIPEIPVSTDAVNALREASWSSSAAETAQGGLKPESTIEFEQYNVSIETIPHWIKVTTRLMADAPAIAAYIDTRLRDGLAQRVDNQLINGNGTSPNISGLTDSGNYTAFSPGENSNLFDAINKAKWELWETGNPPDVAFVNPADWAEAERIRESAGSGMYLYGTPGTVAQPSVYGVTVVPSTHVTAGSFIIGAIRSSCLIYNRQNVVVEMGYVDDDFTRNLVTIRAEERLALSVDKASAIKYGDIERS
jgi:HK97 family phage major capsid protein